MIDPSDRDRPILREVRESDIPFFFEYQSDPEAAEMAAFTPRERDEVHGRWLRMMANVAITPRTVVVGESVAGHLVSWVEDDGHREVGYWLGRQFWGKGVASAALGDFLKIVTDRPVEGWIAPHNAGSARVLEKNGFTFVRVDGEFRVYRLG